MKKLIEKYKARIDEHNEGLDYGSYEETWSYGTILNPLFLSLAITFFAILIMTSSNNQINYIIVASVIVFIGSLLIFGSMYAVNWFMYEKNGDRKRLQLKRFLLGLEISLISLLTLGLIFCKIYFSVR